MAPSPFVKQPLWKHPKKGGGVLGQCQEMLNLLVLIKQIFSHLMVCGNKSPCTSNLCHLAVLEKQPPRPWSSSHFSQTALRLRTMLSLMMAVTGGALEAKISPRRDDRWWCESCYHVPLQVAVIGAFSAQKIPFQDDVCATCSVPGNLKAW